MPALHFDEKLVVLLDEEGLDTFAVEERLAGVLLAGGWVKDSYPEAIHTREESFPTGLNAGGLNIALPHCDMEHVKRGALCVGVLKHPVSWCCMDDPSKTCDVSLVVMLALDEAHAHLEMLQKVIGLLQDQEMVGRIVACASASDAYGLLKEKLS